MFKNRENVVSIISYMNEKDSKMQETSEEAVYTPCLSAPGEMWPSDFPWRYFSWNYILSGKLCLLDWKIF